jgi:hypothetical protein
MAELPNDLPAKPFKDAEAFENWLEKDASAAGLWLKIARKHSRMSSA